MADAREIDEKLLHAALKAMKNAYVLCGFKVGAAALAENGEIYEGCNVESRVSGLGICAERNAINHLVLHGNKKMLEIAIIMDFRAHGEPRPCGACLQYIHDFAENPAVRVAMAKAENGRILSETVQVKTIKELLPFPYSRWKFPAKRGS